ncbi:restriction endonuclease subunit S, partial [Candidatus Dojkabacteria bacterium]|nr:restriction endonuclease subunit S [Candidatus Dojkabacteria bacterium]
MIKRKVKLKDVCQLNSNNFKERHKTKTIRYLDTGNITRNQINIIQTLSQKTAPYPSRAKRRVKNKTIIYSTVRPIQEHFGIIDEPNEDLIVSTGFTTIDVIDDDIDPKFLYYALTQKNITEYLQTVAMNSVSGVCCLNHS